MKPGAFLLVAAVGLMVIGPARAQEDAPVLVSTGWLAEHLDDENVVILQVAMAHSGAPEAFIPGARLIDYHGVEREVDGLSVELPPVEALVDLFRRAGVADESHVILYGTNPAHLAARVFMTLEYLGHRGKTSVLDGGLERWQQEGRPTVREAGEGPRGTFTARVRGDVLISADEIAERLDDPLFTLIDARPADQYASGFIPGAYNLFWEELLVSEEEPRLQDRVAAEARFREAGARRDGVVVNYCQIGMRASYTYLITRHLGYDARFYDGSWNEWSRRSELPREAK